MFDEFSDRFSDSFAHKELATNSSNSEFFLVLLETEMKACIICSPGTLSCPTALIGSPSPLSTVPPSCSQTPFMSRQLMNHSYINIYHCTLLKYVISVIF